MFPTLRVLQLFLRRAVAREERREEEPQPQAGIVSWAKRSKLGKRFRKAGYIPQLILDASGVGERGREEGAARAAGGAANYSHLSEGFTSTSCSLYSEHECKTQLDHSAVHKILIFKSNKMHSAKKVPTS
ncbi:hypothetical protein DR999_PMT01567 [Platysternon megacephalum]|uniref:Uncharacterized protein n=1 Tax=Platysternon megacephalum TaxID=55544 RepID=A0A4D9EW75_9SAUR|nr:hypothetical protein DR999_PMT01567 [Platysternon megacephalum]